MLIPVGLLYIHDVIFARTDTEAHISRWINPLGEIGVTQLRGETGAHVREEFSTFDWIMASLLERIAFTILSKEIAAGGIGLYLRRKE